MYETESSSNGISVVVGFGDTTTEWSLAANNFDLSAGNCLGKAFPTKLISYLGQSAPYPKFFGAHIPGEIRFRWYSRSAICCSFCVFWPNSWTLCRIHLQGLGLHAGFSRELLAASKWGKWSTASGPWVDAAVELRSTRLSWNCNKSLGSSPLGNVQETWRRETKWCERCCCVSEKEEKLTCLKLTLTAINDNGEHQTWESLASALIPRRTSMWDTEISNSKSQEKKGCNQAQNDVSNRFAVSMPKQS
jgi:hypothetical protein